MASKVRTLPLIPCSCVDIPDSLKSPRDAVTISRTFNDATTIIDVTTSLPRSPDEPAYLRPSPPYVRSNVKRENAPQSIESIGLIISMQYSLGVSSLYHLHHLNRPPRVTHQHEMRIQSACVLHVSGSTIFVRYGILVP